MMVGDVSSLTPGKVIIFNLQIEHTLHYVCTEYIDCTEGDGIGTEWPGKTDRKSV